MFGHVLMGGAETYLTGHPAGAQIFYLTALGTTGVEQATGGGAVTARYVVLRLTGAVTPVRIDAFNARTEGSGALLSWHAVSEFQNLGYNVYRRDLSGADDTWNRVNANLIPGTAHERRRQDLSPVRLARCGKALANTNSKRSI